METYGLKKESDEGYDRYLLCVGDDYYTLTDSSTLTLNPSKISEKKFKDDMEAFENQSGDDSWIKVNEKNIPDRILRACREKS